MGSLQLNRDDLVKELSSFEPAGGSGSSASAPDMSAGASIAAAAIPAVINLISNWWSNSRNENLARQQNQWNIEQWNRENAYNNPSAQLARLAGAGINPALAYANGDLMNESAASPQMTSARVTSPIHIDPLTAAQIENLTAQADETRSRIPVNEQTANHISEQIATLKDQYASRRIERLKTFEEFNSILNANNLFYQTIDSQIQQIKAQSHISQVQSDNIVQIVSNQLDVLEKQANMFQASAAYQSAQSEVAKSYKAQLDEVLNQLKAQTQIIEKQKELVLKYGTTKEVLGMINSTIMASAQMFNAMANVASVILSKGQAPQFTFPVSSSSFSTNW